VRESVGDDDAMIIERPHNVPVCIPLLTKEILASERKEGEAFHHPVYPHLFEEEDEREEDCYWQGAMTCPKL
jgi:hypothetical protein